MFGDIFSGYNSGEGCYWHQRVGARDAAKHSTMHRTAPITKNFPTPNVNSVEVEKLALWPPTLRTINQVCIVLGLDLDTDLLSLR